MGVGMVEMMTMMVLCVWEEKGSMGISLGFLRVQPLISIYFSQHYFRVFSLIWHTIYLGLISRHWMVRHRRKQAHGPAYYATHHAASPHLRGRVQKLPPKITVVAHRYRAGSTATLPLLYAQEYIRILTLTHAHTPILIPSRLPTLIGTYSNDASTRFSSSRCQV